MSASTGSSNDEQNTSGNRPVILIVFDDLFDLVDQRNLHGVPIHAPNFDRLATNGVRFSNAFASIAVCNPSRTSFMTGQSPFRTTVHVPEPVQWSEVLPQEATFVDLMKQQGFRNLSCGKVFHNQTRRNDQAIFEQLFDQNFQTFDRLSLPLGEIKESSEAMQADDVHVDWAVEQITNYSASYNEQSESLEHTNPIFLSVGIIRPHRPFIAPQQFYDLYPQASLNTIASLESDANDLDDVSEFYKKFRLLSGYHNRLVETGQAVEFAQGYLACVSYADSLLGRLLDAIEANDDLTDATIIVTSDNGYQLGEKSTWNKFTFWDESAKVPLYVIDPMLPKDTLCSVPVTLLDLAPTITNRANATPLPLYDGNDLVNIALNPGNYAERVAITTMIGSLSIRNEQYRLMLYNDGSIELYDIANDPREHTNLAPLGNHQSVIDDLLLKLGSEVLAQGGLFSPALSSISGTAFSDTLFVVGSQIASGGSGDDVYFVADGGQVEEQAGEGFDTVVIADTEYQIPSNVEFVRSSLFVNNITYQIIGNAEENRVLVTSARGHIKGMEGDDTLMTGNARDDVDGGTGNDLIFTTGGNKNRLVGGPGKDVIIGGEKEDHVWTNLSDEQTEAGNPDEQGDFVLGGDVVYITEDEYVPGVGLQLANGTEFDADLLPFVRHQGVFYVFGTETTFQFGNQLLNEMFDRGIPSDFLLIAEGAGDRIHCGPGDDIVFAQTDDDVILLGEGNNVLYSLGGDDQISAGNGNNIVNSGDGNDDLAIGNGNNEIILSTGDDEVRCGRGRNQIQAGPGDDVVVTMSGEDFVNAGEGNDDIRVGAGRDLVFGRGGNDSIFLQAGDDVCIGGVGDDWISGGVGNDQISGNAGLDVVLGQNGNDELFGGFGNDSLHGGSGDDFIDGQADDDELTGGPGDDELVGGGGADTFWFPRFVGTDTVRDLNPEVDRLRIPVNSTLHALTDQQILAQHIASNDQDTIIFDGEKVMIFKDTTSADLMGVLERE